MKVVGRILCFVLCVIQNYNLDAQSNADTLQYKQIKSIFGATEEEINNFVGRIYYLPTNTNKLPDFSKLEQVGEIYTNSLNIAEQDFSLGFPGVTGRVEYFAIDYKGRFYLEDEGIYCFLLGSDDGSKLFIDDMLVINNDYQHVVHTKTNCISLSKGFHSIEVQYFQGPRYSVALFLRYKNINDKSYKIFNLTELYPVSVIEKDSVVDVSIGDEILFEFNSYQLNDKAKQVLGEIKRLIIDKEETEAIIIEGHTDDIGSEEYNLQLSIERAKSVKSFLTQAGGDPKIMTTMGYGESKPKFPNTDEINRKKNRRIEISIVRSK